MAEADSTPEKHRFNWWAARAGLAGLLVSVVALLLSWESNQISRKANSPQVILLDIIPFTFNVFAGNPGLIPSQDPPEENIVLCTMQVRFANLGGAATSITDFVLTINFGDEELSRVSGGSNVIWIDEPFLPGFVEITSFFVTPETANSFHPLGYERVNLPIPIDEYSARTVANAVVFYGGGDSPEPFWDSMSNAFGDTETPVALAFTFDQPDGVQHSTPAMVCSFGHPGPLPGN